MTPEQLGITPEQYANIETLIEYASKPLAVKFDIAVYAWRDEDELNLEPDKAHWGTVACFAGLGPHAGLAAEHNEYWQDYIDRVFGTPDQCYGYWWLFSMYWGNHAETATVEAAVARAKIFLATGIPKEFDFNYEAFDANGQYGGVGI